MVDRASLSPSQSSCMHLQQLMQHLHASALLAETAHSFGALPAGHVRTRLATYSCSSSQPVRGDKHCSSSMHAACGPQSLLDAVPAPVEPCVPLQHAQHHCVVVRQDDWTVLQASDPSVFTDPVQIRPNLMQHMQTQRQSRQQAWPGLSNSGHEKAHDRAKLQRMRAEGQDRRPCAAVWISWSSGDAWHSRIWECTLHSLPGQHAQRSI